MSQIIASDRPANDGIVELSTDLSGTPYSSADMAPTTRAERRWGAKDFAVLWISMSACIPTYMLASSLLSGGMNWKQAVATIFLGNLIVLVPMVLNAHAGTKYGIPFPVYCRASFGLRGANVPALLRALVACGWFGIQTWIGGSAIYTLLAEFFPAWKELPPVVSTVNMPQLACFFAFWLVNMAVISRTRRSSFRSGCVLRCHRRSFIGSVATNRSPMPYGRFRRRCLIWAAKWNSRPC
jgi:NCS1 family nucleobase:cation symporter-1